MRLSEFLCTDRYGSEGIVAGGADVKLLFTVDIKWFHLSISAVLTFLS